MKKRAVIGLKIENLIPSAALSVVMALALFLLPYAANGGGSLSVFGLLGQSPVVIVAVIAVALSALLGVISFIQPTVIISRIWTAAQAVSTAALFLLMFSSKKIIDGASLLPEAFLVKNFGAGYWIAFIAALVGLVFVMRLTKINTGYIVLVVLSIIWLFPVLWIILTSLRGEGGYYVGYFFPKQITLQNFVNLFGNPSVLPFGRWYMNTLIVALSLSVINTLIILATAYVLSRTRFAGRKGFMNILMIIGMFPGFMSMLAVYNILKGLGMNQSLIALVVVGAAGAAMGFHISKGFMDTMPKALDEAATIDGANRWQIFTKIMIPLCKPIIIYTALTSFLGTWSDYIFPSMLFGDKQANYTTAVGLYWMTDFRRIDGYYTQFAAGAVVVALPIVILFIALQRYYVEGLSGAVKG